MYLSEYASRRARKVLKPTVELLAGIPSVVYGFFALSFVTPTLLQDFLSMDVGFTNALAAGLVLGVMVIPTIASLVGGRDDRRAPGAATGVVRHGCQPDADHAAGGLPGGPVRASPPPSCSACPARSGETMIVALAAGSLKNLSLDPREGMQAMTGFIATTAGGENPVGSTSYNTLFAVGLRCS